MMPNCSTFSFIYLIHLKLTYCCLLWSMFHNARGLLFSLWVGLPHCVHMEDFLLQRSFFSIKKKKSGWDEEYMHLLVRGYIFPVMNASKCSYMDSKAFSHFSSRIFACVTFWAHIKERRKSNIRTWKMLTSDACTKQQITFLQVWQF